MPSCYMTEEEHKEANTEVVIELIAKFAIVAVSLLFTIVCVFLVIRYFDVFCFYVIPMLWLVTLGVITWENIKERW